MNQTAMKGMKKMTNKDVVRRNLDNWGLQNVEVEHYLAHQGCWCCVYDYCSCECMNPPYDDSKCVEGKILWMYKELPELTSEESNSSQPVLNLPD